VLIVGGLSLLHLRRIGFAWRDLARNWVTGLAVAAAASYFVIGSLDHYPVSARPEGAALIASLVWVGIAYGLVDALVLNVFPVMLARGLALDGHGPWLKAVLQGLIAILISAGVTLLYHLGYSEFRGWSIVAPVFGNVLITATFIVSGSPLAPLVTHVAMHIGAVLHGMETVPQLPPHY
jgi:hypothetical protein